MKQALILIDIQEGFYDPYWGVRNNPQFERNAEAILQHWRRTKQPLFHVQHLSTEVNSPLRPDRDGSRFMAFAQPKPGEAVVTKNVNSAFIGTDLESQLRNADIKDIVLIGLTTDHCVSTSTRMAANLGFRPTLVQDATATFNRRLPDGREFSADTVHEVSVASLNGEFAQVVATKDLLRKIIRHLSGELGKGNRLLSPEQNRNGTNCLGGFCT